MLSAPAASLETKQQHNAWSQPGLLLSVLSEGLLDLGCLIFHDRVFVNMRGVQKTVHLCESLCQESCQSIQRYTKDLLHKLLPLALRPFPAPSALS